MTAPLADALLDVALDAARRAGALLLDGLARRRVHVGTKTTATDMVSEMDHASEALIVEAILAARPDDAIVGEEGGARPGASGVRWIVDPLDGTTNYLYNHPRWAVSIAVEVGGEVVAGVVVDPSVDEAYWAVRGRGAFCNGDPIAHTGHADLATALVATGFSYEPAERARQAAVLNHLLPRVRDVRRHGAAALDLCWLARGRVDAYYEGPLEPWDVAAGQLIAAETGAYVGTLDRLPAGTASAVAATPGLAPAFLRLLAESGAPIRAPD